jgi:hypothetical protein
VHYTQTSGRYDEHIRVEVVLLKTVSHLCRASHHGIRNSFAIENGSHVAKRVVHLPRTTPKLVRIVDVLLERVHLLRSVHHLTPHYRVPHLRREKSRLWRGVEIAFDDRQVGEFAGVDRAAR